MSDTFPSLVSTQWLAENLGADDLIVLDASLHLPGSGRDARAEFHAASIPDAIFMDLAAFHTASKQALSSGSLREFQAAPNTSRIVLYDDSPLASSARAWVLLKGQGYENLAILDGGLQKWRNEGRALQVDAAVTAFDTENTIEAQDLFRNKADMLANLDSGAEQVLDARSADRVFGSGDDPVHGGANGRIPGSFNLPFTQVFNEDGTYKSPDDLREALIAAGIDLDRPVVTTCGSGVTASVLLFALHLIGKDDVALYDGSWSEWGSDPDTPKAQGPA